MEHTNREGLTFEEWVCAAGVAAWRYSYTVDNKSGYYSPKVRAAWKAGEDPTEWRARA